MPYCTNCGAKIEGTESFCPFCGESIKVITKTSESSTKSEIAVLKNEVRTLQQQLQDQNKPVIYRQQKQDNTCFICCFIVIFFLIIITFIPWFLYF